MKAKQGIELREITLENFRARIRLEEDRWGPILSAKKSQGRIKILG